MKLLPDRAINLTVCLCWALAFVFVSTVSGQTNYYGANGTETNINFIGAQPGLPGDQVFPDVAISSAGGFVVWQDNVTDGDGSGISATRLEPTLSASLTWQDQRVNVQGAGNQEKPRVALLKNGGAVFVWQGGAQGFQHIFARFLTPSNTWLSGGDLVVSTFTNNFQASPAVTVLNNSNVVMVWSSFNQAGSNSMQDVYAKILSPAGTTVSNEFLVNQTINFNQRTPAVAALQNGGFVIAWISEQQNRAATLTGTSNTAAVLAGMTTPSVDVYARFFAGNGAPQGNEFQVNLDSNPCATPAVAAGADGGFILAWGARDMLNSENSWDVYARSFASASSNACGVVSRVNTHLYGDQYAPRISSLGVDYMVVWTSLAQDGSREGVYGQFLNAAASPVGAEIRVNTTTVSQQMQPVVASDGISQFVAVWTSFTGSPNNFDLFAQRYLNGAAVLLPMPAPYVWSPFVLISNKYQPQLVVSWSAVSGLSVSNYEVYVDGAVTPVATVISNQWIMTAANGLTTNSTHAFQVDYVLTDRRRSPISDSASGKTWGGGNWGGIPFEWMQRFYGSLSFVFGPNGPSYNWPDPNARLAPGGPTLQQVFLSGGDPGDPATWLQTQLSRTKDGYFQLRWNTVAGATYQVQVTTNFGSWSNVGSPRFAAGGSDSIFIGAGSAGYYRVYLLR